jgi:predicted short-subunit dehydrogenase-like oxidoreductase (DUF2520 family)
VKEPVAIAGAGRLGQALARALREVGVPIACIANGTRPDGTELVDFTEIGRHASRVLIAVSDKAIESVAARIAASPGAIRIALHTCGAFGAEPLRPLAEVGVSCGSLHPLQTIRDPHDSAALRGIAFAVTGDSDALAWAGEIVALLQGWVFPIHPDRRQIYHAAAVMASNHVTAVLDAAGDMMRMAGLSPGAVWTALAPLVRSSVENTLRYGPLEALTGPVARGDSDTVSAHMHVLDGNLLDLYRAAALRVLTMATAKGLDEKSTEDVRRVLLGRQ